MNTYMPNQEIIDRVNTGVAGVTDGIENGMSITDVLKRIRSDGIKNDGEFVCLLQKYSIVHENFARLSQVLLNGVTAQAIKNGVDRESLLLIEDKLALRAQLTARAIEVLDAKVDITRPMACKALRHKGAVISPTHI
jgi:hypothetical protein